MHVCLSVGMFSKQFKLGSPNCVDKLVLTYPRSGITFWVKGQRSRSECVCLSVCSRDNSKMNRARITNLVGKLILAYPTLV